LRVSCAFKGAFHGPNTPINNSVKILSISEEEISDSRLIHTLKSPQKAVDIHLLQAKNPEILNNKKEAIFQYQSQKPCHSKIHHEDSQYLPFVTPSPIGTLWSRPFLYGK